ncbi:MAG: DUF4153 domain-containing protein [Bacteroidales bacterium]|nr:DUF4153 domain-containing protein [Bacteroidales bacterium]
MGKFQERMKALGQGVVRSVREFPLETLLGLVYFVLGVLTDRGQTAALKESEVYELLLWFVPQYVLLFAFGRLARRRTRWYPFYLLAWFLWIPLFHWGFRYEDGYLGIAWILVPLMLVLGDRKMDNVAFGRNVFHTVVQTAFGLLIGLLLAGIVSSLIASVNFLFALNLSDNWTEYSLLFLAFVVTPLLCCTFVSKESTGKGDAALRVIVDYILSPALVAYAVILFLYIVRILLRWELPDGGVAYMVLGFLVETLLCYLLRMQIPESQRHFEWFYRPFPYIALAPLALLWIGAVRRIGEYGITGPRFYLLVLAVVVTLFVLRLLRERPFAFRRLFLVLIGLAVLFTYIPGIRAKDFGIRSQGARLEKLLPVVLVDGKFPVITDYGSLVKDTVLCRNIDNAYNIWSYLKREMKTDAFERRYGGYGEFVLETWRLRQAKEKAGKDGTEEEKQESVTFSGTLEHPVDVGPYTQLIPSGNYAFILKEGKAFFLDKTQKDTLLVCSFAEKIQSLPAVLPQDQPDPRLIYQNDRYMVVFPNMIIWDSGRITATNGSLLFKKP